MRKTSRPLVIAAGVLTAAAVVAPAYAATTPRPTSLTVKAVHSTVTPTHHKDGLTATLKWGTMRLADQQLVLKDRAYGTKKWSTWQPKATLLTNSKGQHTFVVSVPGHKGHKEQYEVVYHGGTINGHTYKSSHSSIITVTVV